MLTYLISNMHVDDWVDPNEFWIELITFLAH